MCFFVRPDHQYFTKLTQLSARFDHYFCKSFAGNMRDFFNLGNTLHFVNDGQDHLESIGFATSLEEEDISRFYINHQQNLSQFVSYFTERAGTLITQSEKELLFFFTKRKKIRFGSFLELIHLYVIHILKLNRFFVIIAVATYKRIDI